jgi:membrane associated rhomboid family serine protease
MFLPLHDDIRSERAAVVNWLLILANVAAFAWMVHVCDTQTDLRLFAEQFGLVPERVVTLIGRPGLLFQAPVQIARDVLLPFVTHMFVHGGVLHLLGNMLFLVIFGNDVEGRLGSGRYLVFYFVCGILAAALHIAVTPHSWSGAPMAGFASPLDVPMVGASGAIAGVLGAYVVWFPRARVSTLIFIFVVQVPALLYLGIWFLLQYFAATGALNSSPQVESVAYWAHVGGFMSGVTLALMRPRRSPSAG